MKVIVAVNFKSFRLFRAKRYTAKKWEVKYDVCGQFSAAVDKEIHVMATKCEKEYNPRFYRDNPINRQCGIRISRGFNADYFNHTSMHPSLIAEGTTNDVDTKAFTATGTMGYSSEDLAQNANLTYDVTNPKLFDNDLHVS
jgi:hypothetical protein